MYKYLTDLIFINLLIWYSILFYFNNFVKIKILKKEKNCEITIKEKIIGIEFSIEIVINKVDKEN